MIAPAGQSTARACLRSKLAALVVRRQAGPATWGLHAPKTPNKEVGRPTGYANAVLLFALNACGPSSVLKFGSSPEPPAGVNSSAVGAAYMPPATYRGNPSTGKGPGCRPPSPLSSATRLRQSVGAEHARPAASPLPPCILCIVGRGLDRLTAHNERRQPAKLARSCGCLPCRGKHCSLPDFAPLNRGPTLTTPHLRGASGTPPPLQHNPQSFSLPQTSAAAWGQAALHPTLPHSVGRAFARNSFTPPCRGRACPARSLAITTPYPLHRRAASHRAFA